MPPQQRKEKIALGNMSLIELRYLLRDIQAKKEIKEREMKQQIRQQAEQMAANHGLSFEDLFPNKEKRPYKKRKSGKLYANPDNRNETWSGMGRTPRWMTAKIEEGYSKEDFRID